MSNSLNHSFGNGDNNKVRFGNGVDEPISSVHQSVAPIKRIVRLELSDREFDTKTLPDDMKRVYDHLAKAFGEEYGLLFVFNMRTAVELHRAWHMTLLTSNILQQVKDKFKLRMTWNLGVVRLKFRVEDGGYELHRKVPYDYDSEYQDIYYRIAVALIEGHISIHEALLYQDEARQGLHTAKSGQFLRDPPGRLILYPAQAATCAIIFFGGKWLDAGVAAICGFAAGLLEYALSKHDNRVAKVLVDVIVGIGTGLIGGLWFYYAGGNRNNFGPDEVDSIGNICLPSVFLGTLYWFFYGTAFVIGLLEIIAGELETGVTRFVAVSVKTFVLSLGSSVGLMMAAGGGAYDTWVGSNNYCDDDFVKGEWWRILMYLACSVAVLGQYRMPLDRYWIGLAVQLAAYEAQFQVINGMNEDYTRDHLDTATSNIVGAMAGVFTAFGLSAIVNSCRKFYVERLVKHNEHTSLIGDIIFATIGCFVKAYNCLGIGRESDVMKLHLRSKIEQQQEELNDPTHPRERISLTKQDEHLYLEALVGAQNINIWAILMPAVYQLVPGSIIARLWYHAIFPPTPCAPCLEDENEDVLGRYCSTEDRKSYDGGYCSADSQESVFSNLMVISTSLALGLIFGFACVQLFMMFVGWLASHCWKTDEEKLAAMKRKWNMTEGMYTADTDLDPSSRHIFEVDEGDGQDGIGGDALNKVEEEHE